MLLNVFKLTVCMNYVKPIKQFAFTLVEQLFVKALNANVCKGLSIVTSIVVKSHFFVYNMSKLRKCKKQDIYNALKHLCSSYNQRHEI